MKDMIQQMTNIETEEKSKKQKINESASMNISMTADDAGQVGQLMAMMRNAGMDPKPVAADMPMPMRKDIDKFRSIVDKPSCGDPMPIPGAANDDPKIPGKDDVPGDMDLKAGVVGKALAGTGGAVAADALDKATGGVASKAGAGAGMKAGTAIGGALGGPAGAAVGGALGGAVGSQLPKAAGAMAGSSMVDDMEAEGDYANSPDEQYRPASDVINPPTNDLNKSKKSYPKVAGGDNPMALADRIKEELSSLYKEYK